jgi:hypothetical protein
VTGFDPLASRTAELVTTFLVGSEEEELVGRAELDEEDPEGRLELEEDDPEGLDDEDEDEDGLPAAAAAAFAFSLSRSFNACCRA